jgi:hypothetical protein
MRITVDTYAHDGIKCGGSHSTPRALRQLVNRVNGDQRFYGKRDADVRTGRIDGRLVLVVETMGAVRIAHA